MTWDIQMRIKFWVKFFKIPVGGGEPTAKLAKYIPSYARGEHSFYLSIY